MSPRPAAFSRFWIIVLLGALGFLAWVNARRIARIESVTAWQQDAAPLSADSATGYADGTRELIVADRLGVTQETIALTQQMLAAGELRPRSWAAENAPFGREVHSSSLYRWWLGTVAWLHHIVTDAPMGRSVERAALYADPLLHALWLVSACVVVAWTWGGLSAAVVAMTGATAFPWAAAFLPGLPEAHAIALVAGFWSVLPLLAGWRVLATDGRAARRWFICAGIAGGIGLWNSVAAQMPLLLGLALGALLAWWVARDRVATAPWRIWGLAGAATVLFCWLVEFFPGHLVSWELRAIHPLHALAWLGLGELLQRVTAWMQRPAPRWQGRDGAILSGAVLAVVALPLVMLATGNAGFLAVDPAALRVAKLADTPILPSLQIWVAQEGVSWRVVTVVLPLVLVGFAAVLALRRRVMDAAGSAVLAMAIGPVLVAAGLACFHLRGWQMFDAGALALIVAVLAVTGTSVRWQRGWVVFAALWAVLGLAQARPEPVVADANGLTGLEREALLGRHVAQRLARRTGMADGAVFIASPGFGVNLRYYGGLRGLASLSWENKDGLAAAIRVMISTSRDETQALLAQREVRYFVLPSWDEFYDPYVEAASVQVGSLFLPGLQRWILPPWLRPIPCELPRWPGLEQRSVVVLEVVEEQAAPLAASRLVEYFIEMSQPENARAAGEALRRFPADLGALVARAQLESALGDAAAFADSLGTLEKWLATGADRILPWDRRVSLASVLARGRRYDLARAQVQRCIAEIDEERVRTLTPYATYHLLGLARGFGIAIADSRVRELAVQQVPAELRGQL